MLFGLVLLAAFRLAAFRLAVIPRLHHEGIVRPEAAGRRVIARPRRALPEQCPVILRPPARQARKISGVRRATAPGS